MRQFNKLPALLLLVFILLTGCGGPPLAQPEEQEATTTAVAATQEATSEPTTEATLTTEATEEATPTTEPTEGATVAPSPTEETPPPTGEATAEPTPETPTAEPTTTTELTATATIEPTPTLTTTAIIEPTPTLTLTVVTPKGGVTVGKYTFSFPQGVPTDFPLLQFMGWLPDSPNEIVDTYNEQILAIDVYSGKVRKFSEVLNSSSAISLLKNDLVAFATNNPQRDEINIWISGSDENLARSPVTAESHLGLMVTPDQESLLIYNPVTQQAHLINKDKTKVPASSAVSSALAPLTISRFPSRDSSQPQVLWLRSTSSPNSRWTAVYNLEHFALIDLVTGETQEINLTKPDTLMHVESATWSPDGHKLALLITDGEPPVPYMKLFVLNVAKKELQEIKTDFEYVTNATWAPDSEHILISAETGTILDAEGEESPTSSLFLVNTVSAEIQLVPILPKGTFIDFFWQLSWAPDGQKIALSGYLPGINQALSRIDVTTP